MYDHTNPTHRTELRLEVVANQVYYGDPGSTKDVLAKLQDRVVSRAADPGRTIFGITGFQVGEATIADAAEYAVVVDTSAKQVFVDRMVNMGAEAVPEAQYPSLLTLFSVAVAPTIRALLFHRRQDQSEANWGEGSRISAAQYHEALGTPNAPALMNQAEQDQYVSDYMDHYVAKAGKPDKSTERARIVAKAASKQSPGQTATWS